MNEGAVSSTSVNDRRLERKRRQSMKRTRFRVPVVVFLTAIVLGAGQSMLAQSPRKGQGDPPVVTDQYNGPGIKGKMGSTKNSERWAAAIRKANRQAEKIRKDLAKGKG
jgi:hypothetical protein